MTAVLLYNNNMEIVSIKQGYTDYLFSFDNRVSKNVDKEYVRPYLGVVFRIKNLAYFAPLTSSGKGKKLAKAPKPESITFYPIANCKLGGINLNNMIPLVNGVYSKYTDIVNLSPKQKMFHENQLRFLRKNQSYIRSKALKIYRLKIAGRLYSNYDAVTCDFKKLEDVAAKYDTELNEMSGRYGISREKCVDIKKQANDLNLDVNTVARSYVYGAKDGTVNKQAQSKVRAEVNAQREQRTVTRQVSTQEKTNNQQPVAAKPKRKDSDQNSR